MSMEATLTMSHSPIVPILDAVDRGIATLCRSVVLLTGIALLVSIGTGVAARYVMNVGGIHWAEELPKQLFPWFIMAGVVLALQTGNHIAVDLVMRFLGETGKRLLIVLTNLIIAGAYIWLCLIGLEVAEITAAEINPMLGTPGSLPFYALAAGSALTALGALVLALRVALLGPAAAPQPNPEESVQ